MKKHLKYIFIFISKVIMSFFYDSSYLKGRHFDNSVKGWIWCWKNVFLQKVLGYNKAFPYPVSFRSEFGNYNNIKFHIDDMNNFQHFGCYFQSWQGEISIGKGSYIAPNVGLITANHNPEDLDSHKPPKNINIGKNCWIGMNTVILPGVSLGNHTIVGAGSVVTKSFEQGNCIVAGNPAKIIKHLNESDKFD